MNTIKNLTPNQCWFWHNWKLIKSIGLSRYHECADCGSRKATQIGSGYQPIDFKWLLHRSD